MHKSLLEILEAEKKIVNDVNFFKDSCNNFRQELGIAEEYICFLMEQ